MKKFIIFIAAILIFGSMLGCDNSTTSQSTDLSSTTAQTTTQEITTQTETESTTFTTIMTTAATTTEQTTTLMPTTQISYTGIEVTEQYDKFFRLDEEFDKSSIQLTAYKNDGTTEVVPSELFQVRGYSSSTPGEKTLFIIFDRYLVEISIYILEDFAIELDMPYYEAALNLQGDLLRIALNNILHDGFIPLLYGDARDILPISDVDPENSNNIILVYTGNSVDSTWDSGLTWNREHTWPQSRLGVSVGYGDADFPSKATDIHNLKPADPDENALRSNDYFSNVNELDIYVPRDEVKGDIARILFYMSTMYYDLTLDDDKSTSTAYKTMGMLSILLEWNMQDPVDEFEMHRNEILYSYQGNRNPFIDYPELANLIWGEQVN